MKTAKGPWAAKPYTVTQGKIEEWTIDGPEWINFATVYVQEDGDDLVGAGEANARLMAAAPELLAACEALLEFSYNLMKRTNSTGAPVQFADAQAAIRKARGTP